MSLFYNQRQHVHQFEVRAGKDILLCPTLYSDEQFDQLMQKVKYMPFGLMAAHFPLGVCQRTTHEAMQTYRIADLDIEALFFGILPCPVRLKNRARQNTYQVISVYKDFALVEAEEGYRVEYVDGERCCLIVEDFEIIPLRFKEAKAYMKHHRHNSAPQGHKFSLGLKTQLAEDYIGVVIASEPKARNMQNYRKTLEINRVCADARFFNANSKLYGQAIRAGRDMGYTRFITYSLPEESGASLKAVGFRYDGAVPPSPKGWDSPSRRRKAPEKYPTGEKLRWILEFL